MPCYSRIQSTVEFGDNTDPKLLALALRALGYTVTEIGKNLSFAKYASDAPITGTYRGGTMTINGSVDQNEMKRAYSAEVVKSAAKRFGWQVKQSSPTQLQVTRRA